MTTMLRLIRLLFILTVVLLIAIAIGLPIFLRSWLPSTGKALLIERLEQHYPIRVSIAELRYEGFKGLRLEQLEVTGRATGERWALIPQMEMQANWIALLLQQRLSFRGRAPIQVPCMTMLGLTGSYDLRSHSLLVEARTTPIAVRSLQPPLTRYVPPALAEGLVALHVTLKNPADGTPIVLAHVSATSLAWNAPGWRLRGEVTADGSTVLPGASVKRWTYRINTTLRNGTLEGLPTMGTLGDVQGDALITEEGIEIQELTATVLGSPWKALGRVSLHPAPAIDVLLTSRVALPGLAEAFPVLQPAWRPEGAMNVRAVCRGPINAAPRPDCLVEATLDDASLGGTKLPYPLTNLSGRLDYDHLTQALHIERLSGRLHGESLAATGDVQLRTPLILAVGVTGNLPIAAISPWLPPGLRMEQAEGIAGVDLRVEGSPPGLSYRGRVELHEAQAVFQEASRKLDQVTGAITLGDERIDVERLTLRLDGQPLTISATVTPAAVPRIAATVEFPKGAWVMAGRLKPDEFLLDEGRLALAQTRLQASGRIGRRASQPSALTLSGTLELSELGDLPFVNMPQLESWRLRGTGELQAQLEGPLPDLPGLTIRAQVRAGSVSVRDVPIEQLVCDLSQNARGMYLRIPSALVAQGRLRGDVAIEHRAQRFDYFLANADITNLQLVALAQAIPAWRDRGVAGQASAHATLSGSTRQRPSWRGEGWLNAGGEHLGELPLLNRVFQGLFGLLADRLGLEMLRRAQITQASVQWRLEQERFLSEDLRLGGMAGAEPVAIYAKGSVGLDQTLDLIVEPELSEGLVLQAPGTSTLASTVLKAAGQLERFRRLVGRHRLTGTLKQPQYFFEFSTQDILRQLAPTSVDFFQGVLDAVR